MLNFHDYIKEDFQIPYDLEKDIRATIDNGFRLLKFPTRLEKRYHQDIFPLQQQRYFKLGIWAIVLYNLFIFTDWFMIRDIYLTAWITRLGICTDRKSTRLNSSHVRISYAVFCLKKQIQIGRASCRERV